MASYDELSLKHRLFMRGYSFSRFAIGAMPAARMARPLASARVALVTTAGMHEPGQADFDHEKKGGDVSFREISNEAETARLRESHRSSAFDHTGVEADRNLAFPLDRFRELRARGEIGELNRRHFSFMGSIIKPQALIEETAPEVARRLREDGVTAVFLTPV